MLNLSDNLDRKLISRVLTLFLILTVALSSLIVVVRFQVTSVPALKVSVNAGQMVRADEVTHINIAVNSVYPDTITGAQQIIGYYAQVDIGPGSPLKTDEFLMPVFSKPTGH